jgi:NADH-quinone oxidoreductase subunit G
MIKLIINNIEVEVENGATILDAAKKVGVKIPTLCHLDMDCFDAEHVSGSCRICVVEVEGRPNLVPSCCTPATEGMVVKTNSISAINARRTVLDLLLSDHPKDCLTCVKNMKCELQSLANEMGLHNIKYKGEESTYKLDIANQSIVRDLDKCIMCRRCEFACNDMQTVGILSGVGRGFDAVVAPSLERPLADTKCTFCGQCVMACPVGALTSMDNTYHVWTKLNNPKKHVVVQVAPAVRVAIGEEFGMEPGTIATGKLTAALRAIGFDAIFDTDFAADLTIMEETTELIERVTKGENLPILTSCCPGWVKFFEHQFPELLNIPSTPKSPQQMFGAVPKTYYAENKGIDRKDMVVVSVMPCLAKKYEANREEFSVDGNPDVDVVISTRELAKMIKEAGIQFATLEDSEFDDPLGESTGAGVIFGATGGVLEAALRTAADWLSDKSIEKIDFKAVRGMSGIREAEVELKEGLTLKVAIASSLGHARTLLEKIQSGEAEYHAIEIMACPGGCLNGGGQPYTNGNTDILKKRYEAIYRADEQSTIRMSHKNPSIVKLYDEYLEKPGSHKAHELLHTGYVKRRNI